MRWTGMGACIWLYWAPCVCTPSGALGKRTTGSSPLEGPPGNGLLHRWAEECQIGWINIPGDGSDIKDFIHVEDLVRVVDAVLSSPPPTRESIAVGSGKGISMEDLASIYQQRTGCDLEFGQSDEEEVFGIVDAWGLEERFGFRPQISLEEMIGEAFEAADH